MEDFEAYPLDELAARYDLMVVDHPHVGMASASGCLLPLDASHLNGTTVGRSHESYNFAGRQWALAIDAAAQVAAKRAGALNHWPGSWAEIIDLARNGRVVCALAPVHALMCFFTLCANTGTCCATQGSKLVDRGVANEILAQLREFCAMLPEFCFDMNPIAVFEKMIDDEHIAYTPLIYGYASYASHGFRNARIQFADIVGVRGSTLGGTGIAVSAQSKNADTAIEVAFDLASAATQRGLYAAAGGQPAHRDAWNDDMVNSATHNFYRNTLATLDAAWHRPRFNGYIAFQESAGKLVAGCLRGDAPIASTIDKINELFAASQKSS